MKLLYLIYIDMDKQPTSGSSVRPLKMKQAFETLGIELRTFSGVHNNQTLRKKVVKEVKDLLKDWKPDACYIEPPSGPMFYYGDVDLIKFIHKKGVPISIFYRDAYWKYPEYVKDTTDSFVKRIKQLIIKFMQIYQWNVFTRNIDIIYFPSATMATEFDCLHKDLLPPGCFVADAAEKINLSNPLEFIFVGGAARNHGTMLTIEAFEKVNKDLVRAKLCYICPDDQWNSLGIEKNKYRDWLEIIHTSGDDSLKSYYEKADIALLTAPQTFYRNFAVPVKIFEYISYLKPVLVTNCTETAKIVKENGIGWVVEDNSEAVADKILNLIDHKEEILRVRSRLKKARENNLWAKRAQKVIIDLEKLSIKVQNST